MELCLATILILYLVFKKKPVSREDLEVGDHIVYHVRRYMKLIQHHGIWDGEKVIHFDGANNDGYYVYRNCQVCPRSTNSVRRSCLSCFSHGRKIYRCEYNRSLLSLMWTELGFRSTQPSLPGNLVVAVARAFYDSNNFGTYHVWTHNCEDFARFCKIGMLGSKQVTRALLYGGIISTEFMKSMVAIVGLAAARAYQEQELNIYQEMALLKLRRVEELQLVVWREGS